MTNLVFVSYDDKTGLEGGKGNFIANLEQLKEIKQEILEQKDEVEGLEEMFTFTYITNKEFLVLVKLGLSKFYGED